jgi:threonine/homoserine/homoserine lactone efflux protein
MALYLSILIFAISTTITPGPNNIMIMASGINYGIKKSIPHLCGICLGLPIMIIMIGLGFSIVFEMYPFLHQIIKILGVLYLVYLAWLIAKSSPKSFKNKKSHPMTFVQGVMFQWVNPKAWVIATSAISAYTNTSSSVNTQIILISLIFLAVEFPCVGVWLVFGTGIKRFLKSEQMQRAFNICMALLLIASVMPVIIELFQLYIA